MSDLDELKAFVNQPVQLPQQQSPAPAPASDLDALRAFVAPEMQQEKYGGGSQQAIAGLEGAARGLTLGGSDLMERASGVAPEAMRGRREANPWTSGIGTAAGATGLLALTGGIAAPAEVAMGGGLAATAAGYGLEGAVLGAGSAVSDAALGEPNLNAQSILGQIGMGAIAGIGAGVAGAGIKGLIGKFGGVKGSVSEVVAKEAAAANKTAETANALDGMRNAEALNTAAPAMGIAPVGTADEIAANDAAKSINSITKPAFKENTDQIMAAADRLGLPVSEGMVSANPYIQQAEDSLIQAAPTYSGVKKTLLYQNAWDGVTKHLDEIAPESSLSKAQTGSVVQDGLTNKIAEEYQPIKDLHGAIRQVTPDIPVSPASVKGMSRSISNMDEVLNIDSPQADLARRVSKNLLHVETASDIDMQKDVIRGMANSSVPGEKRMAAILMDKINDWQERAILKHAGRIRQSLADEGADAEKLANFEPLLQKIEGLVPQIEQARSTYKPFIQDLGYLSENLGKGKIYGPQHALDFIDGLDYEQLTQKLTKKNNSEFRTWFQNKYPEQWSVIQQYEKSSLRDAATNGGVFNPKTFVKKFNDLEPEIQKSIFHPDEIEKIKDASTYLESFPKSFNPSGTAKTNAFYEFFSSPLKMAASNARDFGIDQYIKQMAKLPESARPNATQLGVELAPKFNQMNAAQNLVDRTNEEIRQNVLSIAGVAPKSQSAVAALASKAKTPLAESLVSKNDNTYEQKTERIKELAKNPETMTAQISNHLDGISEHLPNVSQSMASSMATSIAFLNSKIPQSQANLPLSKPIPASAGEKQKFNRYFDAVNNPVGVMKQIKTGTLSSEAMESLRACHPELLKKMQNQISSQISPDVARKLPQKTKQALSMFLGTPLTESQVPQVAMANQAVFQFAPKPNQQGPGRMRSTQGGLAKLNIAGRMTGQLPRR